MKPTDDIAAKRLKIIQHLEAVLALADETGDSVAGSATRECRVSQMAFVFYDTETTGTNTTYDQILQFAANFLTDNDFCELDRFEIRCRLMSHVVPAPGALRATRVSHTVLFDSSLPSHYEAICAIAEKLEPWSPAVFIGYNSLSFDETLLRQAFFQNLKPIYLTNTNCNTRADVLRLVQAASVYAPDSIIVPTTDLAKDRRVALMRSHQRTDLTSTMLMMLWATSRPQYSWHG